MSFPFKEATRELWTNNELVISNCWEQIQSPMTSMEKPHGFHGAVDWILRHVQQSTYTNADGPHSPNHLRTHWTFNKCLQLHWSRFKHILKWFVELGGDDESGPQWILWKCMMYLNLTYLCSKLPDFSTESNWKMNNT